MKSATQVRPRATPHLPQPQTPKQERSSSPKSAAQSATSPTYKTLPPGTRINGGTYKVPKFIGNTVIHPYGDFLLHDVGTGDGIPQAVKPEYLDQSTANKFRTDSALGPPLPLKVDARRRFPRLRSTRSSATAAKQSQFAFAMTICPQARNSR